MIDLTPQEIKALLWHLDVVDKAYGNDPPEHSTIGEARAKLERELKEEPGWLTSSVGSARSSSH